MQNVTKLLKSRAQQITEPDRENYADLRKSMYRLESMPAGRLAQIVLQRHILTT